MTDRAKTPLESALDLLPQRYPGPGGVAVVVRDGKEIAARAWGYASLEAHDPMTRATRLPICSISKQFTCGVLLATVGQPDSLDAKIAAYLPGFKGTFPSARQMCHNQSGLRDYWAMTVIEGATAEQTFSRDDALPMLAAIETGHFTPGTRYSYCNCNYRILSEMVEAETGEPLEALYRRHIWGPAGMKTAVLTSDTRHPADDVVGYEGSDSTGFFPADNGIFWIGDAGISASLDDMLAYEAWIDATRDDANGIYARLSARPDFRDGAQAYYGFGLVHQDISGVPVTGHGGALRGFRAHRMHARDHRLSVVVIFNHEADAHDAAASLLRAALNLPAEPGTPIASDWAGQWLCPLTGLLARVEVQGDKALLHFATSPDTLHQTGEDRLSSDEVVLERRGNALWMHRLRDNLTTLMQPVSPLETADGAQIAGRYRCAESGAELIIEARDGATFALFSGRFGQGRMEPVHPAAPDIWLIRTRRSMDAPAPGDWTLQIRRDATGAVTGATLGCWLAHGINYEKTA